jgi:hypothetical protein
MLRIYKWKVFESGSVGQYAKSAIDSESRRRRLPICVDWIEPTSVGLNVGNEMLGW